jgi:hypothetical protein
MARFLFNPNTPVWHYVDNCLWVLRWISKYGLNIFGTIVAVRQVTLPWVNKEFADSSAVLDQIAVIIAVSYLTIIGLVGIVNKFLSGLAAFLLWKELSRGERLIFDKSLRIQDYNDRSEAIANILKKYNLKNRKDLAERIATKYSHLYRRKFH